MPRRLASALSSAQVDWAKASTEARELAEKHISTSSTYEIASHVESAEEMRRRSIRDLMYVPNKKGDKGDP